MIESNLQYLGKIVDGSNTTPTCHNENDFTPVVQKNWTEDVKGLFFLTASNIKADDDSIIQVDLMLNQDLSQNKEAKKSFRTFNATKDPWNTDLMAVGHDSKNIHEDKHIKHDR